MIPWWLKWVALGLLVAGVWAWDRGRLSTARAEGRAEVQEKWDAERAAMQAAADRRRAEDERAARALRARAAESEVARRFAEARLATADADAASLAARLRVAGADRCTLPADARRVFDDAAGRSRAAAAPAASPDPAAVPRDVAGPSPDAGSPARIRRADDLPVDVVTVWEVGTRNTGRAAFNAAALMQCQRDTIALWEAATGGRYPVGELAPWLN